MKYLKYCISIFVILIFSSLLHSQEVIPGEYIVQLNKESSIQNILKKYDLKVDSLRLISKTLNIWHLKLIKSRESQRGLLQRLKQDDQILNIQHNHRIYLNSITPNRVEHVPLPI